jgi:hypothetical protein
MTIFVFRNKKKRFYHKSVYAHLRYLNIVFIDCFFARKSVLDVINIIHSEKYVKNL